MIVPLDLQYTPTLNVSEEQYDADNVTVTVKWAQQVDVTYTIKVSPWVPLIYNVGSTDFQLTISYNTDFNFSVEAIAPCGNNITVSIRLQYGKILCVLAISAIEMNMLVNLLIVAINIIYS